MRLVALKKISVFNYSSLETFLKKSYNERVSLNPQHVVQFTGVTFCRKNLNRRLIFIKFPIRIITFQSVTRSVKHKNGFV